MNATEKSYIKLNIYAKKSLVFKAKSVWASPFKGFKLKRTLANRLGVLWTERDICYWI